MAEENERRRWLLTAIRRLPEDRQELLILKFVEQLSNAEVGKIMDRTEGAIKSLYHRTLLALRDELIQMNVGFTDRATDRSEANHERGGVFSPTD